MGSAAHEAMDVLQQGRSFEEALLSIVDYYEPIFTEVDVDYAEVLKLEVEIINRMIEGWIWRWPIPGELTFVASELSFDIPIINPATGRISRTFRNSGKIDGICELDGRLLIMEHKTTSKTITGDHYWSEIALDQQITRYMLAARHLGYEVQGCMYDVLKKPGTKPKLVGTVKGGDRHREDLEEYSKRLIKEIHESPEAYYARREIPRSQKQLDDMEIEMWQVSQDMNTCNLEGAHYKNSGACSSPYKCEILEHCANDFDFEEGPLPPGFERVDDLHPELKEAE